MDLQGQYAAKKKIVRLSAQVHNLSRRLHKAEQLSDRKDSYITELEGGHADALGRVAELKKELSMSVRTQPSFQGSFEPSGAGKFVCSALATLEAASLASMSFTPTKKEFQELVARSNVAEKDRAAGRRGPMLSKLHYLPAKFGLCPDSLNPDDTVLSKLGRGGRIGTPAILTVVNDRNMPLGGMSCGPNGVLADCQKKYGPNRMNLFYRDMGTTLKLASDYLALRKANEGTIFAMYVAKLLSFKGNYKLNPEKPDTLDEEMSKHFDNVCDMMSIVETNGFRNCGFAVKSFCQTWMRKSQPTVTAQFSVMSPHFQTRFFLQDAPKLSLHITITDTMINSYRALIQKFTTDMQTDYGVGGGGQAFVDIDGLCEMYSD